MVGKQNHSPHGLPGFKPQEILATREIIVPHLPQDHDVIARTTDLYSQIEGPYISTTMTTILITDLVIIIEIVLAMTTGIELREIALRIANSAVAQTQIL